LTIAYFFKRLLNANISSNVKSGSVSDCSLSLIWSASESLVVSVGVSDKCDLMRFFSHSSTTSSTILNLIWH
jgi:hypothetical protein